MCTGSNVGALCGIDIPPRETEGVIDGGVGGAAGRGLDSCGFGRFLLGLGGRKWWGEGGGGEGWRVEGWMLGGGGEEA